MRIEKKKKTINSQLLNKLETIFSGCKYINFKDDALNWVKRIILFIQNELPNTSKYQKFLERFQDFINKKGKLKYSSNQTIKYCGAIFLDLFATIKHEDFEIYNLKFHPKIEEVSLELLNNGHYSEAIFEAVKALNNFVKNKAKIRDKDLSDAMAKAFNEQNPIIKLNSLKNRSEKDEQEGFKFLYMGAMKGTRNPKGHETIKLKDKNKALEYLAFISLLFRRADEGNI